MTQGMRGLFLVVGVFMVVLTIGFYWQMEWATNLWMWTDGRLTYIFIASITAAIAAPLFWLVVSKEWAGAIGGAANMMIQAAGMALFLGQLALFEDRSDLLIYAIIFVVFAVVNAVILWWSRDFAVRDTRPIPRPVYLSFVVFVIVLVLVAIALLLKTPNIFPWTLRPDTSVMIGWVFTGTIAYFMLPLVRPLWANVQGQLLGFLAYDVILILPFIAHFSEVQSGQRLSLIIYTVVVVYSGLLAIYYLFINKATRMTLPQRS